MKYPKKVLQDLIYDTGNGELSIVREQIVGISDWSSLWTLVFKDEITGRMYSLNYSEGATELQTEVALEGSPDMVECIEVEPRQETITVYRAI